MPHTRCSQAVILLTVQRLRALADEARVRTLLRLQDGECNVTTLVEYLGIAQTSVSKHLAVLRQSGVVSMRREGTQSFYFIRDQTVFEVLQLTLQGVKQHQSEVTLAIQDSGNFMI